MGDNAIDDNSAVAYFFGPPCITACVFVSSRHEEDDLRFTTNLPRNFYIGLSQHWTAET